MIKCPKCGFEQLSSGTCVDCGIIFSKYKEAQERKNEVETKADYSRPSVIQSEITPKESNKLNLEKIQIFSGGTTLVMMIIKKTFADADPFTYLILAPFFFSFVAAVSGFLGDGLWSWWRGGFNMKGVWEEGGWSMYEGRWRIPLSIFWVIASVSFAWMFFKLK
jgi:hypothetical protein